MPPPSLLQRLKERKLVQWAVAYLAGAWVLVEATNLVVDRFHWPEVIGQAVIVIALFGFFLTLVLAWYHGEKGRQKVSGPELLLLAGLLVIAAVVVGTLGDGEEPGEPAAGMGRTDQLIRVAVLPLANLSPDPEHAFFPGGIQEDLTRKLGRIPSLEVISRTSADLYGDPTNRLPTQQIAAELGVDYLTEGSTRIAGDSVWITIRLIEGATDGQLWSESYGAAYTPQDYVRVQAEIVQRIAHGLRTTVSPEDLQWLREAPTHDLEALEAYMQGKEWYRREGGMAVTWESYTSIQLFEKAVELDPEFSLALAGLALAGLQTSWSAEWVADSVRRIARRALAITPDLPEARLALAGALSALGQKEEALAHFRGLEEAAAHDPDIAMSVALYRGDLGDLDYEIETLESLERLNPRDPAVPLALSNSYSLAHRYDDALEAMDRRTALVGLRDPGARLTEAYVLLARGERQRAETVISDLLRDAPGVFYGLPLTKRHRVLERLLRADQRPSAYEAALASGHLDDQISGIGFSAISAAIHAAAMGRTEEASAHWDSARVLLEGAPPSSNAPPVRVMDHLTDLTVIYLGLGDRGGAISAARRLMEDFGGSDCRSFTLEPERCALVARVYAHFGEQDAAIDLLEEMLPSPSQFTIHILEADPVWEPLHNHPRFQALLEKYRDDVERRRS